MDTRIDTRIEGWMDKRVEGWMDTRIEATRKKGSKNVIKYSKDKMFPKTECMNKEDTYEWFFRFIWFDATNEKRMALTQLPH